MYALISIPLWLAAAWLLFVGLIGTFHPAVQGPRAFMAVFCFASSSLMAFLALRMMAFG